MEPQKITGEETLIGTVSPGVDAMPSTLTTSIADDLPTRLSGTCTSRRLLEAEFSMRAGTPSNVTMILPPAKRSPRITVEEPGTKAPAFMFAGLTALVTTGVRAW